MEHKYVIGRVDYLNNGRRCEAAITWELKDGRFSMQAEIGNYCAGQCVEEVAAFFPGSLKAQRMLAVWRDWHLNDMTAGSPAQEQFFKQHPETKNWDYPQRVGALSRAGLNPDPNYLHKGKPYQYGTAWLKRTIPEDVIKEIESW